MSSAGFIERSVNLATKHRELLIGFDENCSQFRVHSKNLTFRVWQDIKQERDSNKQLR
jgi:hypothetical protein